MLSRIVKIIQNTVNNDLCLSPPFWNHLLLKATRPPQKKTASTMIPQIFGRSYQSTIIPSHYGSNSNSKIMCVFLPSPCFPGKKQKRLLHPFPPKGWLPSPENSPVFSTRATEVNFTTRSRQLRHLRFGAKAVLVSTGWLGGPIRWGWGERSFGKIDPKQGIFDLKGKRHVGKAREKK